MVCTLLFPPQTPFKKGISSQGLKEQERDKRNQILEARKPDGWVLKDLAEALENRLLSQQWGSWEWTQFTLAEALRCQEVRADYDFPGEAVCCPVPSQIPHHLATASPSLENKVPGLKVTGLVKGGVTMLKRRKNSERYVCWMLRLPRALAVRRISFQAGN